jgi:hypothetical protein
MSEFVLLLPPLSLSSADSEAPFSGERKASCQPQPINRFLIDHHKSIRSGKREKMSFDPMPRTAHISARGMLIADRCRARLRRDRMGSRSSAPFSSRRNDQIDDAPFRPRLCAPKSGMATAITTLTLTSGTGISQERLVSNQEVCWRNAPRTGGPRVRI